MSTIVRPTQAVVVAADPASPPDGSTVITLEVIAQIAGIAARRTRGVHAVGRNTRGGDTPSEGHRRTNYGRGVSVRTTRATMVIDVNLTADYPVPLHPLGEAVRSAVLEAVSFHAEIDAVEVNVTITDLITACTRSAATTTRPGKN